MPDDAPLAARSLLCDRCGAPLEAGPRARFVTCSHCGARLSVHRSNSAAWTETLEEVASTAGRIEAKLDALVLRPRLEALEMEWAETQSRLGSGVPGGRPQPPTKTDAKEMGVGIRWVGTALAGVIFLWSILEGPSFNGLVRGGLWSVSVAASAWFLAWVAEVGGRARVRQYAAAERDYLRRRADLLGEPDPRDESDR